MKNSITKNYYPWVIGNLWFVECHIGAKNVYLKSGEVIDIPIISCITPGLMVTDGIKPERLSPYIADCITAAINSIIISDDVDMSMLSTNDQMRIHECATDLLVHVQRELLSPDHPFKKENTTMVLSNADLKEDVDTRVIITITLISEQPNTFIFNGSSAIN